MARYIDADAFGARMYHEAFEKDSDDQRWDSGCWIRYKMFERVMGETPTADVAPIRHGRCETEIITDAYGLKHACYACSVCGVAHDDEFDFCPNCGAKMDGGDGDD